MADSGFGIYRPHLSASLRATATACLLRTPDAHEIALGVGAGGPNALTESSGGGVQLDLRVGDVAIMSSALWHCGGANSSGRRTLLVASFVRAGERPLGSTYSILPGRQ